MKILFELSGEHSELPKAEVLAAAEAEGCLSLLPGGGRRTVTLEMGQASAGRVAKRLALSHHVNRLAASSDSFERLLNKIARFRVPGGTFAVRAESYSKQEIPNLEMEKKTGAAMPGKNRVDLRHPENEFRVIYDDNYHFCQKLFTIDRGEFESRIPQRRPYFSPVSLHPRLARALVNLSRVKKGETLLDPFCGTGGILLEAGIVGAKLSGSDIQGRMAQGCRTNLSHFGMEGNIFNCDIGKAPEAVSRLGLDIGVIATDPPYGRAATTAREGIMSLYKRTFEAASRILKRGKYLSIVLPSHDMTRLAGNGFALEEIYLMRVHRSLTRHFCAYRKV